MKTLFKIAFVLLIFVVNLAIAQPSLADRPKVSKNPDYIQVTKTLNGLSALQETQDVTPEVQQRIDLQALRVNSPYKEWKVIVTYLLGILDYGFFNWVSRFTDCVSGCGDRCFPLSSHAAI